MKLVLTCPECGCSNWERNEEGSFVCANCGQEAFQEDMPASAEELAMKDWEKLYMASKRLAMEDLTGAKALTDEVLGTSPDISDIYYWAGIKLLQYWDWYQVPSDFRDWAGAEFVKRYKAVMSHSTDFKESTPVFGWCNLCLEAAARSAEDSYDKGPDTAAFLQAMMEGTNPERVMDYFYANGFYVDECASGYYIADHEGDPISDEVYQTREEAYDARRKKIREAKCRIFEKQETVRQEERKDE